MSAGTRYNEPMAANEHTTDGSLLLQDGDTLDREARVQLIDAALDSILTKDAQLLERLADA